MVRDDPWLSTLELGSVRRGLGARAFERALGSTATYVSPPAREGDAVVATLEDPSAASGGGAAVRASVRVDPEDRAIAGECSRCSWMFGPCVHAAVLAVDLALSSELREALLDGLDTGALVARAPERRRHLDLELKFDGALRAWLLPTEEAPALEIAATPFGAVEPYVGRGYGDASDDGPARILTLSVRRAGERKLLAPKEVSALPALAARDRRVLEHARERGSSKKALFAAGPFASLCIEALRAHGAAFTPGFKERLDFRDAPVRPAIEHVPAARGGSGGPLDALEAFWVERGSGARIPFGRAVFFAGAFPYVWFEDGAIHPVAPDVDLDLAARLSRAPSLFVPSARWREAGVKLLGSARGRGVVLPAPPVFGLPPVETPRFLLRLGGEPIDVRGELVARYQAREIPLFAGDAPPLPHEGRDRDAEQAARARVLEAGLTPLLDEDTGAPVPGIGAAGEAAVDFWRRGLERLRTATDPPIAIALERRLAKVRVGAPVAGRVHVTLEGNWLKTRLEFRSEELPVELSAIRRAIERKHGWVSLSDGTLARISSSVATLAGEAAEVMGKAIVDHDAVALLPPHQLGRLDRWLDENDGSIDDAVRALRARLRALAVAEKPKLPRGLRGTLRPYQKLGVSWLQFLQELGAGGVLADDMGLGKTITTLAYLLRRREAEGKAPSLVVCPTSVATNWTAEAARFAPSSAWSSSTAPPASPARAETARSRPSSTPCAGAISPSPPTPSSGATSTRWPRSASAASSSTRRRTSRTRTAPPGARRRGSTRRCAWPSPARRWRTARASSGPSCRSPTPASSAPRTPSRSASSGRWRPSRGAPSPASSAPWSAPSCSAAPRTRSCRSSRRRPRSIASSSSARRRSACTTPWRTRSARACARSSRIARSIIARWACSPP